MRKFKCTAVVMEWVGNDMIEKWDAVEYIIAEDDSEAEEKFIDGILEEFEYGEKKLDIDDIKTMDVGAADLLLSVRLSEYVRMSPTMTVGELVDYLEDNFEMDSKIYLASYGSMVAHYGAIDMDCFEYAEEE